LIILIGIVAFIFVATLAYSLMPTKPAVDPVQERLKAMAQEREVIDLTEIELQKPFTERVLKPILDQIGGVIKRFTPIEVIATTQKKLVAAGINMQPITMITLQVIMAVVLPSLLAVFGITSKLEPPKAVAFLLFACAIGYFIPNMWLKSKVGARRMDITRALPDALDLLTISVEAGLGFDQALMKVVEKSKSALSTEFGKTLLEIRMGKPRREALKDMASRVDVPDLNQFISALVQADKLGVSIGNVLRVQSDQMRNKRRQRAEETAMKAPLKMSFVLVFFVLPALLIVLLGPAAINVIDQLGGKIGGS
jgi:tight adherence protein C